MQENLHCLISWPTDVLVEDKLATLIQPPVNQPKSGEIIISTVGFVSNSPSIADSFKATLEETSYADLIIHLVDAAPDVLKCYKTTKEVLDSLDCSDKPTLILLIKWMQFTTQLPLTK